MSTDVAKISIHKIEAEGDALNIAIIKKLSDSTVSRYEIRYFGFDFSHKHRPLSIPKIEKKPSQLPNIEKVNRILKGILESVFLGVGITNP